MRSGSAQATRSGFCERAGAGHRPPPKCVGFCDKSGEDAWISWDATEGHLPQRQTDLIYATTCAGTASLKKGCPRAARSNFHRFERARGSKRDLELVLDRRVFLLSEAARRREAADPQHARL